MGGGPKKKKNKRGGSYTTLGGTCWNGPIKGKKRTFRRGGEGGLLSEKSARVGGWKIRNLKNTLPELREDDFAIQGKTGGGTGEFGLPKDGVGLRNVEKRNEVTE